MVNVGKYTIYGSYGVVIIQADAANSAIPVPFQKKDRRSYVIAKPNLLKMSTVMM